MSQEEKKEQILRIAAEEFACCGYSGASTNTITRRAGISKGILFHYYGSKKELFLLLLEDAARRLADSTADEPIMGSGASLYDHMAALFLSKAAYFVRYPLDMGFLERAQQEQSQEVRADIVRILTVLAKTMRQRRVDVAERAIGAAKLRQGVTKEQALECVMLALEALDAHFYAIYRGKGAELMTNPGLILDKVRLFLDVVARGLFVE